MSSAETMCRAILAARGYARRNVNRDDVDDLLQTACLTALELDSRLGETINHPTAYALGILRLTILSYYESKRGTIARGTVYAIDGLLSKAPSAEQNLISEERLLICKEAMEKLPPRHRELVERSILCGEEKAVTKKAMGLTDTQYRLDKSRVKAKLVEEAGRISRRRGFHNVQRAA